MTRRLRTAVLLLTLPSLAWGQSLGEVAQKEKERRKQNEQAGVKTRVVTEEDLKNNKGQLANDPGAASAKSATPATKPAQGESLFPEEESRSSGPDRRQQEASWRARAAQARERIAVTKKTYEFLNSQYLAQGERFVDEQGRTVIASVEQLRAMIAKAKSAMDAAEKALVDLEESARRQSVPPGWLR